MPERTILHCDLNAFYASVELLSLPELRDKPVAVCGDPKNRHGIIVAKNEHAKRFGVATAETIERAKRKCPQLVLIPPHHERYVAYSRRVSAIYQRYTDLVEPFGIDESWLDITNTMHLFGGNAMAIAKHISQAVIDETGLTISIGISFCKVIAKLGSDLKKPNGITEITRENYARIVYPLPSSDLLYVGKMARASLERLGLHSIGDIARYDRSVIEQSLGKWGLQLHDYANGIDPSSVNPEHGEAKSIGNGLTFRRDLVGEDDLRTAVVALSDEVAARLRASGLACGTVQLTIRDPDFHNITRQQKLERPTHLAHEIIAVGMRILRTSWPMNKPVRMLTVTGMQLSREEEIHEQTVLFGDDSKRLEKLERLESAVSNIRDRYGRNSIHNGRILGNDIGLHPGKSRRGEKQGDPRCGGETTFTETSEEDGLIPHFANDTHRKGEREP